MIYRVTIVERTGKIEKTIFDGELAGEGVGQVGRIADQIRGGFQVGMGGNVIVKTISYVGGEPKVNELRNP